MESLNPTLNLALFVRFKIQTGASVRTALAEFQMQVQDLPLYHQLNLLQKAHRESSALFIRDKKCSEYRKFLFEILYRGMCGEPILEPLTGLIEEMQDRCVRDIDEFVTKLPFKALIPMMLLIFPGFLLLILGPLLMQLAQF